MKNHTEILWRLARELLSDKEQSQLHILLKSKVPSPELVITFDAKIEGPSITRMNCMNTGRYAVDDRDIFRPLQYCGRNFLKDQGVDWENDAEWHTRDLIEMSSLHIESLIKNIGSLPKLPLGRALKNAIVKRKVDSTTWKQIEAFVHVYNDAKHNFSHDKDTHLFSIEDALLSYFVCRKLGLKLYSLASLVTDMRLFDHECSDEEKKQIFERRANKIQKIGR